MYNFPAEGAWLFSQLDWKQLGLLAAQVMYNGNSDEDIVENRLYLENKCLCSLIEQGKWNKQSFLSREWNHEYDQELLDFVLSAKE